MKNIKETDRIIRAKLKNHVVEMPDHLWDKIEAKRNATVVVTKESSRTKWLLLLLLLLVGSAGTWTILQNNQTPDDQTTTGTSDQNLSLVPTKENTTNEHTTSKNTTNHTNENTTALPAESTTTVNQEATLEENAVTLSKTSVAPQANLEKTTNNFIKKPKKSSSGATEVIALAKRNNRQISNAEPSLNRLQSTEIVSSTAKEEQQAQTVIKETELGVRNAIKDGSFLKEIKNLPNEFISLNANPLPLGSLPDPKCAKFGNSSFGFNAYLDWYISPDYAFRTLEAKSAEYLEEAARRDETESYLYAYSTGLRFSAVAENGLAFRSGIAYSQINEKFDYESGNETRISIKNELDPDGNVISSDTTIQVGTHLKTSYNRYRMIDIPLILGYEVETKNFTYSLNAGVYLNLLFTQKGDFIKDGNPTNFTSNRTDAAPNAYRAFKDKLGFSLFGSFGFNYKLNDHMQILLEPHIRYHLNPVNRKEYLIDQSYITAGFITGVRFKF